MKLRHFTIPIFIPEVACPNRCIYCNQFKITGLHESLSFNEIRTIIEQHLHTLPKEHSEIEIGFFGGNFTGLDLALQHKFLNLAKEYYDRGDISGIRMSTRPDYISVKILDFLKQFPVKMIELGLQSTDNNVLAYSERGYERETAEKAAILIRNYSFNLGLQMMIGLPYDTYEKTMQTAKVIVALGAKETRIYPALVIRNTRLEDLFNRNKYQPLTMEEAITWSADLLSYFEENSVRVIRLGLHPSEDLQMNGNIVAGPYHPSFRQLVETKIWNRTFSFLKEIKVAKGIRIVVNEKQLGNAAGFLGQNKKELLQTFRKVSFKGNPEFTLRQFEWHLL